MLKRHSEVLATTLVIGDLFLVGASWLAAYLTRFRMGFETPLGDPGLEPYLLPLLAIIPLFAWLLRARGLYHPRRTASALEEMGAVWATCLVGTLVLISLTFFARSYFYSRGVVLLFFGFSALSLTLFRASLRAGLRYLRSRGHNLRHVLVVGAGRLAEEVVDRIHDHASTGLRVLGALSDDPGVRHVRGAMILGGYDTIKDVVAEMRPDQVIVALPREDADRVEKLLIALDDETTSVVIVPDLLQFMTLRSTSEDFDGLPLLSLRESPLLGWAAIQKRAFDAVSSGAALVLLSPLLLGLALAIRITSGSPVLYRQERMGLDGRVFSMLKFRTMRPDAEAESGPVWTEKDDPRRTKLGAFMRATNLDELPQFWNVFRGDMSVVGPRPERPEFISGFRHEVPGYMLRHKVKAGMVGWAQVHGWRGNTSLHERIEHDLYYIQNWSFGLDLRIIVMTLWRGFRNAY